MPIHKRLQVRIEHMRKFRHQHEQLRTVIVRVLRPSLTASGESSEQVHDPLSFDSSETSAIEVT